jgi:protein tyrosine phosphatase (PTP) superfamily phosphohydrolase (DUF442 family)
MPAAAVFNVAKASLPVYNNGACKRVTGNNLVYYVTAQPTAYPPIKQAGIRSVLCVRDPSETTQPNAFDIKEADSLIPLPVSYTNVPLPHVPAMMQGQFDMQAYNAAVAINSWTGPLLVHCSTGDRASAAFAVFMIQFCGWPNAQAASFAQAELALANALFIQQVKHYTRR